MVRTTSGAAFLNSIDDRIRCKVANVEIYTHSDGKKYYIVDTLQIERIGGSSGRDVPIDHDHNLFNDSEYVLVRSMRAPIDRRENPLALNFVGGRWDGAYHGGKDYNGQQGETIIIKPPFGYIKNGRFVNENWSLPDELYHSRLVDVIKGEKLVLQILLPVDY